MQRWSAARIGEALALTWGDLNGVVTFRRATTKTKTTRQVPAAPRLIAELVAYREAWQIEHGQPWHLVSAYSRPWAVPPNPKAARRPIRRCGPLAAALDWKGEQHSFRRSLATTAVRRGVPLHVVQRITGHKASAALGAYLEADDSRGVGSDHRGVRGAIARRCNGQEQIEAVHLLFTGVPSPFLIGPLV